MRFTNGALGPLGALGALFYAPADFMVVYIKERVGPSQTRLDEIPLWMHSSAYLFVIFTSVPYKFFGGS